MKRPPIDVTTPLIWALLALLFFTPEVNGFSFTGQNTTEIQRPFDSLANIPKEKRTEVAALIHKNNFRQLPEAQVMALLNQLTDLSVELDDKALESLVFDLKADYYAVNNPYNDKTLAYYKEGIEFARKHELVLEEAIYLFHEGWYYHIHKHNNLACLSFLQSLDAFKKFGFDRVPNMGFYYSKIADFYYRLGDYPTAKLYLQHALKHKFSKLREKTTIINTLGLIARNTGKYQQSLNYFNQAMSLSRQSNDTVWVGIVNGNIGSVYFLQGDYQKALPYIQADYENSNKYGENINAAMALLRLVKINLSVNNKELAMRQLDIVEKMINNPVPDLKLRAEIYQLKAQIYELSGMYARALDLRKKYQLVRDTLNYQNNIAAIEVVRMQYLINKKQAEESRLMAQARIDATKRNAVFIVFFLLLVILILIYSRQALKTKKDKELLTSEKMRVDEELRFTEMKLNTYTENLRKNNTLIESFKTQIAQLKQKDADGAVIKNLEQLMQAHIMTDGSWLEFKRIFLKVYPNFMFDVKKNFRSLSETDIRLLTLIKLQSTNKEIANMLGITVEGVKKAKQRLRKKMNLEVDITIEEAISKL